MTVDPDSLRRVMGNFATGCTVMTLPTDPPHGMTANAFASVSLDPPLCLVCVDHGTSTYELLQDGARAFAVNILTEAQVDIAEHFASMRELDAPFETKPTTTVETGSPIFEDSIAYLDCSVEAAHPAGDHTIYVGRVEAMEILDGDAPPLTFFRGEWGTIAPPSDDA